MKWLIGVAVWGERCVGTFLHYALPSLRAALSAASVQAKFEIHTDDYAPLKPAMTGLDVEFFPLPFRLKKAHEILGEIHRRNIKDAEQHQPIVFWCADMVMSVEFFAAAQQQLNADKKLIMISAHRTLNGQPPIGAKSRELLVWAMQHQHPIIQECFWGRGHIAVPWAIYFQNGDSIALRAFHLHPAVVVKDRELKFAGLTVDYGLASLYSAAETYVVADIDEMSALEISPVGRTLKQRPTIMTETSVAEWARINTTPAHRRFFHKHSIRIAGTEDCGDQDIADAIVMRI